MQLLAGTYHDEVPTDMVQVFKTQSDLLDKRNSLTPLMRNEWICWVTIVKKSETRVKHITRMIEDITKSKKRPCCRPGCPHHRPDAAKRFK